MSIEHQTALSIIDLKPAIQPRKPSRIWLVILGATATLHHLGSRHRWLVAKQQHAIARWHAHRGAPATCRYTLRRN